MTIMHEFGSQAYYDQLIADLAGGAKGDRVTLTDGDKPSVSIRAGDTLEDVRAKQNGTNVVSLFDRAPE